MEKHLERIRDSRLHDRVVTPEEAASWIQDGMTLGLSGFTRAGDVKAVPFALADRAKHESFKVNVYTGASLGSDVDKLFAEAGILGKRLPFQADPTMRKGINQGIFYLSISIYPTRQSLSALMSWILLISLFWKRFLSRRTG